jgi:hypothetical protein
MQISLKYCGIFVEHKNCGDTETNNGTTSVVKQQILKKQKKTAVARERLERHVPAATDR